MEVARGDEAHMSTAVQHLLESFEALPEEDKHELASAILRWSTTTDHPALTDDELARTADAIFVALDQHEDHGPRSTGG
jgi:hypothetical protein